MEEGRVGRLDVALRDDRRVVHHAVEFTVSLHREVDQALRAAGRGQVFDVDDAVGRADLGEGRFREILLQAMDDDLGAFAHAALGDGLADAGGAAGDEDDFILEAHGQTGLRTDFTTSPLCIFSKAVCQSVMGQTPPMIGRTSNWPLAMRAMTRSQMGQL